MNGLVALTSGSAVEERTHAAYAAHLAGIVYTGQPEGLPPGGVVWLPEGTPRRRLAAMVPQLEAVLDSGGTLLMFGDQQAGWPSSARWTFRSAGGAGATRIGGRWANTEVGTAAQRLHHHGVLTPPPDAERLLTTADDATVAYLEHRPGGGTLLVSTIDPLAHFGRTGAPDAAAFLEAFLPWVRATFRG